MMEHHNSNRKEIDSRIFYMLVRDREKAPVQPVQVDGRLDFSGVEFRNSIVFKDVVFSGGIILSNAIFRGDLKFINCRFDRDFRASGIKVDGNLLIQSCKFTDGIPSTSDTGIDLSLSNIGGSLLVQDLLGAHRLKISDSDVRGLIEIKSFELGNRRKIKKDVRALNLNGANVGGSVKIGDNAAFGLTTTFNDKIKRSKLNGCLSAKGMRIEGELRISHLDVLGWVDIDHTSVDGPIFLGGANTKNKNFSNRDKTDSIHHDFTTKIRSSNTLYIENNLSSRFIECSSLIWENIYVQGNTFGDGILAKGSSEISNFACDESLIMAHSDLGSLFLFDLFVKNKVNLFSLKLEGILRFFNIIMGNKIESNSEETFRNVNNRSELIISSANVGGQIDIISSEINGKVTINGSDIGSFNIGRDGGSNRFESIFITNSKFRSYVNIRGLLAGPEQHFLGLSDEISSEFSEIGISINNSKFYSTLRFWLPDKIPLSSANIMTAWKEDKCDQVVSIYKFEILNCEIDGDLDLTRVKVLPAKKQSTISRSNAPQRENDEIAVESDNSIDPVLNPTRYYNGGIDLRRSKVRGDILFRSPQSTYEDLSNDSRVRECAKIWMDDFEKTRGNANSVSTTAANYRYAKTEISFLILRGTEAGSIDLTGLRLRDPIRGTKPNMESAQSQVTYKNKVSVSDKVVSERFGHVFGEGLLVNGELKLFVDLEPHTKANPTMRTSADTMEQDCRTPPTNQVFAHIPGSLHLEGAEIGDLKLTACSFRPARLGHSENNQLPAARKIGVVLDNAQIGHLWVPPLESKKGDKPSRFPAPLDLSGAKIGGWSFDLDDGGDKVDEVEVADNYIELLQADEHLNRDVYRSVYSQLRNSGKSVAARRLFVAEHKRAFVDWKIRSNGIWKHWETDSSFAYVFRLLFLVSAFLIAVSVYRSDPFDNAWGRVTVLWIAYIVTFWVLSQPLSAFLGKRPWFWGVMNLPVLRGIVRSAAFCCFGFFLLVNPDISEDQPSTFFLMVAPLAIGLSLLVFLPRRKLYLIFATTSFIWFVYLSVTFENALHQIPIFILSSLAIIGCLISGFPVIRDIIRALLNMVYRLLFRYGASPARLGFIIMALPILSFTIVTQNPNNFELSDPSRALIAAQEELRLLKCVFDIRANKFSDNECNQNSPLVAEGIEYKGMTGVISSGTNANNEITRLMIPAATDWGIDEKIWITLRYHVPIVAILARGEYDPTDDANLLAFWPDSHSDDDYVELPLTPEDWFVLMVLINWILWPVWLTFLLRAAFRDSNR